MDGPRLDENIMKVISFNRPYSSYATNWYKYLKKNYFSQEKKKAGLRFRLVLCKPDSKEIVGEINFLIEGFSFSVKQNAAFLGVL